MMLSMDFLISCLYLDVSADLSIFYLQSIKFCPSFTAVGPMYHCTLCPMYPMYVDHSSNSLTQFLICIVYLDGYVNPFKSKFQSSFNIVIQRHKKVHQ